MGTFLPAVWGLQLFQLNSYLCPRRRVELLMLSILFQETLFAVFHKDSVPLEMFDLELMGH